MKEGESSMNDKSKDGNEAVPANQPEHLPGVKVSGQPQGGANDQMPAAGPHARKDLTDFEKTPGSGMLPGPDEDEAMQPSS
jgi:hypothetical protein